MKRFLLVIVACCTALSVAEAKQKMPENSDDRVYCYELNPERRRIVAIPNIDGYITLKGDFHMHTSYDDATVSPQGRVREAWAEGLDVIAMTPHIGVHKNKGIRLKDYNIPYELAAKEAKKWGVTVIKGVEITRAKPFGHMNALFLSDCNGFSEKRYVRDADGKLLTNKDGVKINDEQTLAADLARAEEQNAFILWNHPGWPDKKCTMYPVHKKMLEEGRIHAVELFNAHEWYPKVLDWFDKYELPMMANTDAHSPTGMDYGKLVRPMTIVFAKENTVEGVREALFAKRFLAFFAQKLAGDGDLIKQLITKSLQVRVLDAKKGLLEVTNISDIEFTTMYGDHMNPVIFSPREARRVTVPKGTVLNFTNCFAGRNTVKMEIW
ncbi:MAG: hypothetical protein IJ348_01730 [Alistipes sp.]|nr:hypothetical protein [Alistipes sp.]